MLSLGMRASSATCIARVSFVKAAPRLASTAFFLCLIDAHLEWPATGRAYAGRLMGLISREGKGATHHSRHEAQDLEEILARENFRGGSPGHAVDPDAGEKVEAATALAGLAEEATADMLAAGFW